MSQWRKVFLLLLVVVCEISLQAEKIGSGNIPEKYEKMTKEWQNLELTSNFSNTEEKIVGEKFDYEGHKVVTKDGYILSLHRIVHRTAPPCKPPILFMAGLFGSSLNWVARGREYDLPYLLTDDGYDVWLGDQRGNRYSAEHVSISPSVVQFWNFSYHEVGMYDVPAMVDYILARSSFPKLNYVGMSMGGTVFFVMCSELPAYNDKVESALLFAPFVGGKPSRKNIEFLFTVLYVGFSRLMVNLPITNLFPRHIFFDYVWKMMCSESHLELCSTITGVRPENLRKDSIKSMLSAFPAGTSTNTLLHILQNSRDRFQKFDLGRGGNMLQYGRPDPPLYNMSLITAPVALYYGLDDTIVTRKAMTWVSNNLPNVIRKYAVPDPHFGHLDFILGNKNVALVNDVMELLNEINPSCPL